MSTQDEVTDKYDRREERKKGDHESKIPRQSSVVSSFSVQSEIAHGFSQDDNSPASFRALRPRDTVVAAVNIIEISPNSGKYLDHKPRSYKTRIDLVRDKCVHGYRICIIPSSEKRNINSAWRNLCDLTQVAQKGKRGNLFVKFNEDFYVVVEFKEIVLYQYFKKIMEEILKLNKNSIGKNNTPSTDGSYRPPCVSKYIVNGGGVISTARRISSALISLPIGNSTGEQFYSKKAEEWGAIHLSDWVDHIAVQPEGKKKVCSMRSFIDSLDSKLYIYFENYFKAEGATYMNFYNEILKYSENPDSVHEDLKILLSNDLIRTTFKRECDIMRENDGLFPINYHLVLKKRLRSSKKKMESGETSLKEIADDLLGKKRFLWSILDCRDLILSMLLYQKDFEKYLLEIEAEFFRKERLLFEELIDCEWDEDGRHVSINPFKWDEFLESFNEATGFELQNISFSIMISYEQNQFRYKRIEMIRKSASSTEELEKAQKELKTVKLELDEKENECEEIQNKLLEFLDGDDEEATTKCEEDMELCTDEVATIKVRRDRIEKIILQLKEKKKSEAKERKSAPELRKLEEKIIDHIPGMLMARKNGFLNNKNRKRLIRGYLLNKLESLSKEGMAEFSVKLVISVRKGHKIDAWQRNLISAIDKFYTPNFIKWGFIHANVQISNLGMHWFDNALVMLTDLAVGRSYEEILAIDCLCPLIVNYQSVCNRINALAEEIVRANVNYKYSQVNMWSKEGELNCQEFANRIIALLDYTEFFQIVNNYLEELKQRLTKNEIPKVENIRFLRTSSAFQKVYGKVWAKNMEFQPDRNNIIYFNSHEEIDLFYSQCLIHLPKHAMDLEFPGEYQLLKSFDRAFWIGSKYNEDGEKKIIDCPFNQMHKNEREYKKHQEEETKKFVKEDEEKQKKDLLKKSKNKNKKEKHEEIEGEGEF